MSKPMDHMEGFLAELMSLNGDDGPECGVSGSLELRQVVHNAWTACAATKHPKAGEFRNRLREECLGDPDLPRPPARPSGAPFAALSDAPLDAPELTTVVTLSSFLRLIGEADKERLEANESVTLAVVGASRGETLLDDFEQMLEARLPLIPEDRRRFRLAADEGHGRPFVWFTARDDLQRKLSEAKGPGRTRADVARDALGLIHHHPLDPQTGRANHLVALHFPPTVAQRAGHMRPSTLQGFDNRRFVVRFDAAVRSTGNDWGRSLDLHMFRTRLGVHPLGCRERMLLRLQASLFGPDEQLTFDYLGRVTTERGDIVGTDCDDEFLDLVARDRDKKLLAERDWGVQTAI